MRIVFTDFDGVINQGSGPWLPDLVERLNRITDQTGAKIVIHSTWRYGRSLDTLRNVLTTYHLGVPVTGEILDKCPSPYNWSRADGDVHVEEADWVKFKQEIESDHERCIAIQRWLDDHPEVERYVILDDSARLGHFVGTDQFIKTTMWVGIREGHVERAVAVLTGAP